MSHILPAHASVVVTGGGIMGCSTLCHLAGMGVGDATLPERNQPASGIEATSISAGKYRLFTGTNATRRGLAWFRRAAGGRLAGIPVCAARRASCADLDANRKGLLRHGA